MFTSLIFTHKTENHNKNVKLNSKIFYNESEDDDLRNSRDILAYHQVYFGPPRTHTQC